MVLADDVGGLTAADLPKSEIPYGAPLEAVAVAEAERASELARIVGELGCNLASGKVTSGCQDLLAEYARARGAAQRAAAALSLEPSLAPAIPWVAAALTGGVTLKLGIRVAPTVIAVARKLGPKAAEVGLNVALTAAAKVGAWKLDANAIGTCLRKSIELVAGPNRIGTLVEAIPRCVDAALRH
jgi:hypothetical protein